MKINYNITGAQRKSLVGAISQELNTPVEYLGVPTFAYKVGGLAIDKVGIVTGTDNCELVAALQSIHGFKAVSEEYDTPVSESPDTSSFEDLTITDKEYPDVPITEAILNSYEDTLAIELPSDSFTDTAISNLKKLVESKAALIKKAVGAYSLPIDVSETTLRFPWFKADASPDEIKAYTHFISAICTLAKDQKRVTAKEKHVDNEKYAFRCFLLRLGFIGEAYKSERKLLLAKLDGNGSFKNKESKKSDTAAETEAFETNQTDNLSANETALL